MKRTDDEKVGKLPFEVTFGEQKYKVKVLTIGKAMEWRQKLAGVVTEIMGSFQKPLEATASATTVDVFQKALVQFPESLLDIVLAYATDIPRERVVEEATDEQLVMALTSVMGVAFPFAEQLGTAAQLLKSLN